MRAKEIVYCGLFAALMGVGANVSPFLAIGGVPVTLQLLFAILAGGLLGSRLGTISMCAYLFIGLVGAPVFAQFKGGPASLLSPTFGFIISFIFVAYIIGKSMEKWGTHLRVLLFAGTGAILANYFIGTNYMYMMFHFWVEAPEGFSYLVAWMWMLAYLPLDIVVTIISMVILKRVRSAVHINLEGNYI